MIEIAIGLIVLVIVWNVRKAFYNQSEVWQEKVELVTKEASADLQTDYKELHDKVVDIRKKNDDKWFKMADIDDVMK